MAQSKFNPYLNRRLENQPGYATPKRDSWHTYDASRFSGPTDKQYGDPETSNLVMHSGENWQPIRKK